MLETILVIGAGAIVITCIFIEDKLIAFEDWIAEKIRNHKKKSEN